MEPRKQNRIYSLNREYHLFLPGLVDQFDGRIRRIYPLVIDLARRLRNAWKPIVGIRPLAHSKRTALLSLGTSRHNTFGCGRYGQTS
jgi:hypothetical protein